MYQTTKSILWAFKERMCPSPEIKDIKEKLRLEFEEKLKFKDEHVQDLQKELNDLKKKRICCWCTNTENLSEFCQYLWQNSGYPSYHYCDDKKCIKMYIAQLETMKLV